MQEKFYIIPMADCPYGNRFNLEIGFPDPVCMQADLAFVREGNAEIISMNSIVLREALLNSKELLAKIGLHVYNDEDEKKIRALQAKAKAKAASPTVVSLNEEANK